MEEYSLGCQKTKLNLKLHFIHWDCGLSSLHNITLCHRSMGPWVFWGQGSEAASWGNCTSGEREGPHCVPIGTLGPLRGREVMGASGEEALGTRVPTPVSWVLSWAGRHSVVLSVRGVKGAGHDSTSSGLWDSSCEAGVPVSFWRGQETARRSQRRELGLPQSLAAP